ncbi:MAG: ADP-ribosylglycohydrolase family protein [Acidobacteria bacterium]|nr:ADP-ribosylglycohydrolase family protein [Acidobacteriota bacterium]
MPHLDYATYHDKVLGGWAGKCAGGVVGAPLEGFKRFHDLELRDEMFDTAVPNDDLDLQILWLDLVKRRGPSLRLNDLADHWKAHVEFPWGEYGLALRNLRLGVYPPQSGSHNNWYWRRGMGSPIRSEIWGMLCPGMPEQAAFYASMDSSLDHEGFSVDAEAFLAACEALAFVESDVPTILRQALEQFEQGTLLHTMVGSVLDWSERFPVDVCQGKIKSAFGDADFTSAPMNVAFTLLALLTCRRDMSGLVTAIAMGHDSDCVAATAGAMLGILLGYEGIGERWRKLIGDTLVVSPRIVGIEHAETISGLARETARAGLAFVEEHGGAPLAGAPEMESRCVPRPHHVTCTLDRLDFGALTKGVTLRVAYENLTVQPQKVRLTFQSNDLSCSGRVREFSVEGGGHHEDSFDVRLAPEAWERVASRRPGTVGSAFGYALDVNVDGRGGEWLERGVPFYGSWLLLGPFIRDNPALEPVDPRYPDHGDAPLPSVRYMNHDKVDPDEELLTVEDVRRLVDEGTYDSQPFHWTRVFPPAFRFDLQRHYWGRGERTLFLYTRLHSAAARRIWIAMGCSAPFRTWFNGQVVLESRACQRSWPAAFPAEVELAEGQNDVLVRIDLPTDTLALEVGFKEHQGQHSHQSHWDTTLVPMV